MLIYTVPHGAVNYKTVGCKMYSNSKPLTLAQLRTIAQDAGMSFALGRAAYCKNRATNASFWSTPYRANALPFWVGKMRAIRPSTARRWQAHVLQGGSIKALRHSIVQWRAIRAKNHASDMARLVYGQRPSCKPVQTWVVRRYTTLTIS